jgi:hypothetical protein
MPVSPGFPNTSTSPNLTWINAKDAGCEGDGTTDDTAAIQAIIDSLPSSGGAIYFPRGTYLISASLDTSGMTDNLTMIGEGWSSVLKLANGANCYIIDPGTTGAMQGALIRDLKFDCNGTNQTGASGGIHGYKWRRCTIERCWFHNPWQAAVFLDGGSGDFGYQNKILNNTFEGGTNITSGTNAYGEALRLINNDENQIAFNHFENNGNFNESTYGFHCYDQNGLSTYSSNDFVNGAGAIKLDGHQCRITDNAFDGVGGNCVQMNPTASDTIITGNHMINIGYRASGGSANAVNGLFINAPGCIVKNNYFESDDSATPKTRAFANIGTSATYLILEDNQFEVEAGSGGTFTAITFVSSAPSPARIRRNIGPNHDTSSEAWRTENSGTANITAGNTSVTVSHGLAVTPTLQQIRITPHTSLGSAAKFWISNPTSSQFAINVDVAPGSTVTFGWIVESGIY